MLGRIAPFLAEEVTGVDQDQFGIMMCQNAQILQIVPATTWDLKMIILAMPIVIMGNILVDIATVKQDGMEVAATIVCTKGLILWNFCLFVFFLFHKNK